MTPDDRFRAMVEQIEGYAIVLLDRSGRIETWNAGARRLTGYAAEEMVGQDLARLDPEDPAAPRDLERAASEGPQEGEGRWVRRDGSQVRTRVLTSALRDPSGAVTGFSLIAREITGGVESDATPGLVEERAARLAAERSAELALRSEQIARAQREQLRVTLSSVGDAVMVVDRDGRITFMNPMAEGLTGWLCDEAIGLPHDQIFRIIDERTRGPLETPVRRVLADGRSAGLSNHTLLLARDGSEIPIDDSAAPIVQDDGQLTGVVLVFRDITKRRRAELAALHLASIVETTDDAVISKTLEGVVQTWNQGAERIFGYTADEMIGRSIKVLVPPDHPDEEAEILSRLARGERIDHYETVRVRKDGTRIDVSVTISPMRDAEGSIVGASKIVRDITDRRRATSDHERLLERERQARQGAEAAALRARFLARASEILSSSLEYETTLATIARLAVPEMADWCDVEILGEDGALRPLAIAHADPRREEQARQYRLRYPPDPDATRGPGNVVRTRRSELYTEITEADLTADRWDPERLRRFRELGIRSAIVVPLVARDRAIGALLFASTDPVRRYGEEDRVLAEDLGRRAAMAIDNANLYREVVAADRRKDDWLAMLAHELRNPLATVLTGLHLLRTRRGDVAVSTRSEEMIERQVLHLTRLVDDLLDASRITRGRVLIRRERVNLVQLVRHACRDRQPAMEKLGVRIDLDVPDEPVWIAGDSVRLTQILNNLLDNAAKFRGQGTSVTIRLGVGRARDVAVLSVRDQGVGIDARILQRLFDPFAQGERTLDRAPGGLGVGLAVVKGLVELHGGTVSAHSEGPGKGAEFVIRLPIKSEPAALIEVPVPVEPPAVRGLQILVIEDNQDAAQSLRMLLEVIGHEVRVASTGPEGLRVAHEWQPSVVLCDIGLPGLDGYEVAAELRADPRTAGARLIAITGYGQESDRRRSTQAGFDEHLVKPVDPTLLRTLLAPRAAVEP